MNRLAIALLTLSLAIPATAQDYDPFWPRRVIRKQHHQQYHQHWRPDGYRPAVRYYNPPPRSYVGEFDERNCRDPRSAVGQQHLTPEGAKREANDAWAALVRFHLGEKWMDLKNARHVTYECSRSSIKEAGVTTLGQTFTRCEVRASPCRPPVEMEERQ